MQFPPLYILYIYMSINSINNTQLQQNQHGCIRTAAANANKTAESIFQIDVNSLDEKTKAMWNTKYKDADGDGLISVGDFDAQTLNLSNGSKTFKDYISGILGQAWNVAGGIINNIKAMFIKSNPNYTDKAAIAEQQRSEKFASIIKEKNLKVGDEFVFEGRKYNVGYNGAVIAVSDNTSKTENMGDGVTRNTSVDEDMANTDIRDNGKLVIRRTDYDNGAGVMKMYNSDGSQTEITYRAPKGQDDLPSVYIKERKQ